MGKKKKIWIIVVVLILAAAGVAAWFLVPRQPQDEVFVYSYDMIGYVNNYQNGTESYGVVTTDRVQSIYVSESQQVTELLVYQGQQVQKGDVLYRYDTTLSDLELERKDLSIQQMEINLKNAEAELSSLQAMKPMVIPEVKEPNPDDTKIPSKATLGEIYNTSSGKGTLSSPYYVWLQSGTDITDTMIYRYLGTKSAQMTSPVYVVFRIAPSNGAEYTDEYGVIYQMVGRPVPSTASSGNETPTSSEPDTTGNTESGESTQPNGSSETEPSTTQPTIQETEKVIYMRFFTPSTSQEEEIIWNSGYTSSELESMRNEKAAQINQLKFDIKMGKAELEIMKKEADSGEVQAEFDGVVTSVLEPQNALEMNVPMIMVAGGGGFYVEGAVSELDLSTLQVGQKVTVTSWDNYMTYEGTIVEIGSYPSEDENYFSYGIANVSYYPYKVFIDESAELQEGTYVSMTYQPELEDGQGTMYLENAFLRTENGESYVYVRGADGLLEKRVVLAGDSSDGYMTEIIAGISETDYIAFPYGKEVVEGAPTVEGTWDDLYGYGY